MKNKILAYLQENQEFVSGEAISNRLGISRAAVWKHINGLKESGYVIDAYPRKGYRLKEKPDILTAQALEEYITTKRIGRIIYHYEAIPSTNHQAKIHATEDAPKGTVVISEVQTAGKGRLGRKWESPSRKGIWMSIVLRPKIEPALVPKITQIAAAAMILAGQAMGFSFKVKWPNDIIYNEKKICGILTEMSGEMNRVYDVVLGIGVNVNQTLEDFPEDLREKASSIYMEAGLKINRQKLCANILNAFERLYDDFLTEGVGEEAIAICKEHSILIGKRIFITKGDTVFMAHVEDLNEQGELIVKKEDGTFESLISGEVSVRGEKGYLI